MLTITVRDRVVDAIARAVKWVQSGKEMPYAIAFSADEPYCIVKVLGWSAITDETPNSYAYYKVDGGATKRMERSRWAELYDEYINGPPEVLVGDELVGESDNGRYDFDSHVVEMEMYNN